MADDEDIPKKSGGNTPVDENGPALGPILLMWENSLDRLKILNYEKNFCKRYNQKPLNRVHFSLPGSNPGVQFNEFSLLCVYLFQEITGKSDVFKTDHLDDPNTIVSKLLVALRGIEFKSAFPPQKFKTPYGEPICTVLDFLTQKALTAKGFKFEQPVYPTNDEMEQAPPDDEEESEEIHEEDIGDQPDEDAFFEDNTKLEISLDASTHNIIQGQIDPLEWKAELERVGPKLRTNIGLTSNEWRSHVDQTVTSKESIEKLMQESQGDLQAINKSVGEELVQMKTKEKYINNQYHSLSLEFVEVKHKLEELEKKITSSNDVVSKLTNDLMELSDKLEDIQLSCNSKDSGLNDTSPLIKFKSALQQIKDEIHAYDMRIGVVSNSLLLARIEDHNRARNKAALKAKQRRNKNNKKDDNDDNSLNSGDDE